MAYGLAHFVEVPDSDATWRTKEGVKYNHELANPNPRARLNKVGARSFCQITKQLPTGN